MEGINEENIKAICDERNGKGKDHLKEIDRLSNEREIDPLGN